MAMNNTNEQVYFENKLYPLLIALILLVLITIFSIKVNSLYIVPIPIIMLISIYFYPSAKIVLTKDNFYYKRGRKELNVPWKEIVGVHQDPVFSTNIISFVFSNKFRMSGFFIETTQGFTNYIGSVGSSKFSLNPFKREKLIKEIEFYSNKAMQTGTISVLKQKSKLRDWIIMFGSIFAVPAIIIIAVAIYAFFTKDMILLFMIFGK